MTINEALREHTTSVAFQLTLSKRQIDLLVLLHRFKGDQKAIDEAIGYRHPSLRSWIVTGNCLRDRGLLLWAKPIYAKSAKEPNPVTGREYSWPIVGWKPYKLTKAGTLVINLLKEAGIYQESLERLGLDRKDAVAQAS